MSIHALVQQIQLPDDAVRTAAELKLRTLGQEDPSGTLNGLFSCLESPSIPNAQAAILVTKNLVVSYWSPTFTQFVGPMWPEEIKSRVRAVLLALVASSSRAQIRDAAESIVARIASVDYPDNWPSLMEQTVEMLLSDDTVRSGVTLFKELLADSVREQDFWQFGNQIMQRLFSVISNSSDITQLYALQCVHECMNFFLMGEDEDQLAVLEKVAGQQLSQWNELFTSMLRNVTNNDVLHELIDTLHDLQSGFPELMNNEMPMLLSATFDALKSFSDKKESNQDVIALQVDFLELALTNSPPALQHLQEDKDALAQFLELCVDHACASEDLRDSWADDFNEFITHEQELSMDVWPRPSVGTLIGAVKTKNTLSCLIQYLGEPSHDWIHQESCLFLISCALQLLPIESQTLSESDISGLLVALSKATTSTELLVARSIITSGHVSKYMHKHLDQESSLGLVTRAADMLSQEKDNLIKCAMLKTTSIGCTVYPAVFKNYQSVLLHAIASLIPEAAEDTPSFLVDCFLEALRLDFDAAIQFDEVFGMFFALVAKGTANIELNADILDLVGEFMDSTSQVPESQQLVFNQLLTPVLRILTESQQRQFEYSSDLQFALDVCGVVFERCTPEVIAQDKIQLIKLFEDLVMTCEDPQILQAGFFGYAALMERTQLAESSEEEIQRSLQVTAKLLDQDLEDSAALAAGRLITALLDNFSELGQVLGEVFVVAAKRLIQATHAYLIESLSLAYAGLFVKDAKAAVDLLDTNSLLEPFFKKWLGTFEVVRGADELIKYIEGMQAVFELHDERVEAIQVEDEVIHRPDGLPVTRSKGLKFSHIPLPLKIIKLLVNALNEVPTPLANLEDEDDEWTDEVVYSLEGGVTDARAFSLIMDWFKQVGQQNLGWYQRLNENERNILLKASRGMSL